MALHKASLVSLHQQAQFPLEKQKLKSCLYNYSKGKVLIVGDIMVDKYLHGDAERVSPEAPVPVVLVEKETEFIGGAGNVARNIKSLGGAAVLIGTRGTDTYGTLLESLLNRDGLEYDLLDTGDRPTTVKLRILARKQQMLRVDWENASYYPQHLTDELLVRVEKHLDGAGAIVVSDYGKGLVTESFFTGLHDILDRREYPIPVLVDPKPQNTAAYAGVTLLTPNAKETGAMTGMPTRQQAEIIAAGKSIMTKLECPYLVTTLGADGMALFFSDGTIWHIPTSAQQVFDVTGAGDTVIAAIALGLASGASLMESAILANYSAGIVVGQVGAATATVEEIIDLLTGEESHAVTRWA